MHVNDKKISFFLRAKPLINTILHVIEEIGGLFVTCKSVVFRKNARKLHKTHFLATCKSLNMKSCARN